MSQPGWIVALMAASILKSGSIKYSNITFVHRSSASGYVTSHLQVRWLLSSLIYLLAEATPIKFQTGNIIGVTITIVLRWSTTKFAMHFDEWRNPIWN